MPLQIAGVDQRDVVQSQIMRRALVAGWRYIETRRAEQPGHASAHIFGIPGAESGIVAEQVRSLGHRLQSGSSRHMRGSMSTHTPTHALTCNSALPDAQEESR